MRTCEWCGADMDPEYYRSDARFCDRKCNSKSYYASHKPYYRDIYQKKKRAWSRAEDGRRLDTPIRWWIKWFW